jgi:hypothetical protein
MRDTNTAKDSSIDIDSPAVVQGDLILFSGDICALPGSFRLDDASLGIGLLALRVIQYEHELVAQAVDIIDGSHFLIRRPHLKFPMLNGRFLLWSLTSDAELTVECVGSQCGLSENFWGKPPNDVWPSSQKITSFRFHAAYADAGLSLDIGGELECPPQLARGADSGQFPPPTTFALSGVIPWTVLPYLFGRLPPFFDAQRRAALSAART